MSLHDVGQLSLDFLQSRPVEIEISEAPLSTDVGLLPIRQFDEKICLTEQFAAALLDDPRTASSVKHARLDMVRQRIYGILAGYEDQNDHDQLRSDAVFKLIANRLPEDFDLASQPTLSRFENEVTIADLWRLRNMLIDQFLQSFSGPPLRITLDIDAFDDPAHGQQQLILFHGYYGNYQYLPIVITCAENDMVVLAGLRHGTAAASLGADDDLRFITDRLRRAWPDVQITVRGDSGLGVPLMYDVCEELGHTYTFGIGMNKRLKDMSEPLLKQAEAAYASTGEPQRLFQAVLYQAGSWSRSRFVTIKVEAHAGGTNRRAVVTNRAGWHVLPGAVYDAYAERGESENRNKELKRELRAERLSDHRFLANFFRLYLHTAALNLLVRLRQTVATPRTPPELGLSTSVPAEALDTVERKRFFNRRRASDPLGEGFACTWRQRLIKVAGEVIVRARRVIVRLSSTWPHLDHFQQVSHAVLAFSPPNDSG